MSETPSTTEVTGGSQAPGWLRQYPPLLSLVISLLIAFLVLPSSLNLPQSNPSTVLEFAPVPPEDDDPPPPQDGSLSSLGLGSSSSLSTEASETITANAADAGVKSGKTNTKSRTDKRCVGTPLRQTEDPNSPPCVGFFDGDNGGATWQGVTKEEITVVVYHSGGFISDHNETEGGDSSAGESYGTGWCDLEKPVADQAPCIESRTKRELSAVTAVRALTQFFNDRFQTYGRYVHTYVYFGGATATTASRRSDAQLLWDTVKPFSVVDHAFFGGHNDAFAEAMGRRRVMVFGSYLTLGNKFYRRVAPNLWTFWPDVEHWADSYVSYICQKIAGKPVAHAGEASGFNGKPRVYGLMYTTDESYAGHRLFKDLVKERLPQCGVNWATEVTFPKAGYNVNTSGSQTYGAENISKLEGADVTTVLWLGGMEAKTTPAADARRYYPEWIIAGDRGIDDLLNGRAQNQTAFRHAWVVSQHLRQDRFQDSPDRQAFREANPGGRQVHEYWSTLYYRDMFTMYKAIQVAGPRLNPVSVDQGQHAIPRARSDNPFTAACFYDPGDYTCVKDAHEAWWDSSAPDPNGEPGTGCWRMVRGGKRYLSGEWEGTDKDVFANRSDPCNGIKGSSQNQTA